MPGFFTYILYMYGLQQIIPPTEEPVTLALVREHIRTNTSGDDATVTMYLTAARQAFEKEAGICLMQSTYRLSLDSWPFQQTTNNFWHYRAPLQNVAWLPNNLPSGYNVTWLPFPPLQSVTSIKYYDLNDVLQTLSTSIYNVDSARMPGRVTFYDVPSLSLQKSPKILIDYVAGYGNSALVPYEIKMAICLLAANWYKNRESIGTVNQSELPQSFKFICAHYWTGVQSNMTGW